MKIEVIDNSDPVEFEQAVNKVLQYDSILKTTYAIIQSKDENLSMCWYSAIIEHNQN